MNEVEKARALFESLESCKKDSLEIALRTFKIREALLDIKA